MPGRNLTRDEAERRAQLLVTHSYDVTLDLTGDGPTFPSTSVVRFDCTEPGVETFIDLAAPAVRSITLNGEAVATDAFDGNHIVLRGLRAENELVVVADSPYMHTGEGLHRFVDPVDGETYIYTQFESNEAHRVYACFDQPDLKATFELTVRAPGHWQVVSNMAATSQPVSSAADAVNEWRFGVSPRMSTYITAIVAGPYVVVRDRHRDIDLGIYARASLAQYIDADELFTVTKQGFDWYEQVFDYPYPFGKYDQLFVPEFNAGAMENAGAVTFLEDYLFRSKVTNAAYERRAETILHEMAHMWFGDLVTMRWWDDLWLNESFASYMAVLCQVRATKYADGWTTFANNEKGWAYRQDLLPSTHPVAADMPDIESVKVNFDGITYAKGASVLKQLVAWVSEDAFFTALRGYFRRHEFGNTTLADLLGALEESSGRDLSLWSKEWLETAGVNTLRASFETDGDGTFTSFAIVQDAPPDWPTLRSHRLAIGLYDAADGGLVRRDRIELDVVGGRTEVPQLLGARQPDLVLVNDDDLTYARIRLDERSLATATDQLGALPSSLARALVWSAAWDMTRDAELAARDYLRLVLRNIDSETHIGVVQALLRQCQSAIAFYSAPDNIEPARAALASAAREHMSAAEPGSDHQLAWARTFIPAARRDDDLAEVRGLLDGTVEVPGLTVDTDLRWLIVTALASVGAGGEELIAAELTRDATSAGQRHAATARAAVPTSDAKAAAFESIINDESVPNAILEALIAGFQQPHQRDLLAPYADPYFAALPTIWENRTIEMAQDIVIGMYPSTLIDQSTIDRSEAFLRAAQPVPALRRLVVEGADGVARALRARAKDASAAG
ncbi:MAG: aminopeptidase N [Mycobacteriales bacterium]